MTREECFLNLGYSDFLDLAIENSEGEVWLVELHDVSEYEGEGGAERGEEGSTDAELKAALGRDDDFGADSFHFFGEFGVVVDEVELKGVLVWIVEFGVEVVVGPF